MPAADDPRFARVVKAFAAAPELAAIADEYLASKAAGGKTFGSRALRAGGKIFAFVSSKGRLVVKLPAARVDALVAAKQATHFDPGHGRKMKEWAELVGDKPAWTTLAKEAHAYVTVTGRRRPRPAR